MASVKLYILGFRDGSTKVGISGNPRQRAHHIASKNRLGAPTERIEIDAANAEDIERHIVRKFSAFAYRGEEYFRGPSVQDLADAVQSYQDGNATIDGPPLVVWMDRHNLSVNQAASIIGKSQRMVQLMASGRQPLSHTSLLLMDLHEQGYKPRPWCVQTERAR